ncbi:FadR/GntR family transcriptional regulator [Oikeobacillus pervagus]|nr:FadR/GntR family transcriptional regulator [Oikeobacillus pervagus]
MSIKKATRISLVDQVATQMEQLIETGTWPVGEKIPPEMELMVEFDVSRNTLREAVRALVHAGLLETKQGSGTIVRSSSSLGAAIHRHIERANLFETLEVRLALEREAAQKAAERRNDQDIKILQESMKKCWDAAKNSDHIQFIEADILFHKAVVQASHNQMLIDLYEHITDALNTSVQDLTMLRAPLDYEKEIHQELYEAILAQDTDQAVKNVNSYMDELKRTLTNKKGSHIWGEMQQY